MASLRLGSAYMCVRAALSENGLTRVNLVQVYCNGAASIRDVVKTTHVLASILDSAQVQKFPNRSYRLPAKPQARPSLMVLYFSLVFWSLLSQILLPMRGYLQLPPKLVQIASDFKSKNVIPAFLTLAQRLLYLTTSPSQFKSEITVFQS